MIKLLQELGADEEARDKEGKKPKEYMRVSKRHQDKS
jgi:hypothetical protein